MAHRTSNSRLGDTHEFLKSKIRMSLSKQDIAELSTLVSKVLVSCDSLVRVTEIRNSQSFAVSGSLKDKGK